MTNKADTQKSIAEQIFDEFIVILQGHKEFDTETLERLRQLAQNGDLRKAQQVAKAIKVLPEHKA